MRKRTAATEFAGRIVCNEYCGVYLWKQVRAGEKQLEQRSDRERMELEKREMCGGRSEGETARSQTDIIEKCSS